MSNLNEINKDNYFNIFEKLVIDFKKKTKRDVIVTNNGTYPLWEYELLVFVGAISAKGIIADGYTVYSGSDEVVYDGKNEKMALAARESARGGKMINGPYTYALYQEYKKQKHL